MMHKLNNCSLNFLQRQFFQKKFYIDFSFLRLHTLQMISKITVTKQEKELFYFYSLILETRDDTCIRNYGPLQKNIPGKRTPLFFFFSFLSQDGALPDLLLAHFYA